MRHLALAAALLLAPVVLTAPGCGLIRTEERVHAELLEAKRDHLARVEALWSQYGGSDVSREIGQAAQEAGTGAPSFLQAGLEAIRGTVQETDRAVFEEHLAMLGRGERPRAVSERARAFFAQPDVMEEAGELAALQRRIADLEAELLEMAR